MVDIYQPQKNSIGLLFSQPARIVTDIGYDDFHYVAPLFVPRVQDKCTIHFILSGSGTLKLGGKTHALKAGDIFVIPAGVSLCYYPNADNPWRYVWFGVTASYGERFGMLGFSLISPVFTPENPKKIAALWGEMTLRCQSDCPEDLLFAEATLFRLLSEIAAEKRKNGDYLPLKTGKDTVALLTDEIIALINANYTDPDLSVETLCRLTHVSHSYACRFFKAQTGMTIRNAITEKRMRVARSLLGKGKRAAEVAPAVGYRDVIHFSKEFRAKNGQTPREYRNAYRNDT